MSEEPNQPLGPLQTKLLAMLRSGKYRQTNWYLKRRFIDGDAYCCLGVTELCAGRDESWEGFLDGIFLSLTTMKAFAFFGTDGEANTGEMPALLQLNDNKRKTFSEIADIIESNPAAYFMEPK